MPEENFSLVKYEVPSFSLSLDIALTILSQFSKRIFSLVTLKLGQGHQYAMNPIQGL